MTKLEILDILTTIQFAIELELRNKGFSLARFIMSIGTLDHSDKIAEYFDLQKDYVVFEILFNSKNFYFKFDMRNLPEDEFEFYLNLGECNYDINGQVNKTGSFIECFKEFIDGTIQFLENK